MSFIGEIPNDISVIDTLNSIGETILIADKEYTIRWMNSRAVELLSAVAPLYGLSSAEDMIGINMDRFHKAPKQQRQMMKHLTDTHRARINIQDQFVADIIVTPIKNDHETIEGYVVMLMDVTTKAEEEKRKDKLIEELSTPIIKIWDKTIALPLIGSFDQERSEHLTSFVLKQCAEEGIEHALIDLSGINSFDEGVSNQIHKLNDCLRLIGTECIIVGITPKLAMTFGHFKTDTLTFKNAHAGLEYIIKSGHTS